MKFIRRLLAHLPSKLPQGVTAFNDWSSDIIDTYDMPDNDSIRFAIAVQILHLPATAAFKPKAYFGHTLIKGAASQVAGQVMQELKDKQAAAAKAEQEAAESAALSARVAALEPGITEQATQTPVADTTPIEGAATDVKTT